MALPRQVHSANVVYVKDAGRPADTDAVYTDVPGLCVAVKTADCIPVLLYAKQEHPVVAAVHAGWRGTVSRIVCRTLEEMAAHGLITSASDCGAIIGPGISQASFEVGDEGQWLGKDGDIDIIFQSDTGDTALGVCKWQDKITHSDLEHLYSTAKKARLEGDMIYLFSTAGFDAWLQDAAMKSSESLKLIGIDELTNG